MSDIESKMKADLALVSEESSGSEDKGKYQGVREGTMGN